jgi:hypothetical protein
VGGRGRGAGDGRWGPAREGRWMGREGDEGMRLRWGDGRGRGRSEMSRENGEDEMELKLGRREWEMSSGPKRQMGCSGYSSDGVEYRYTVPEATQSEGNSPTGKLDSVPGQMD